jgi:transcriptional regulator with XRE-family HTH domain
VGHAKDRSKRVAEKLKQIREALGLSQREMAERLTDKLRFTVTPKKISQYEHGKRILHLEVGLAYARVGKVPMDQIIDDEQDLTLEVSACLNGQQS